MDEIIVDDKFALGVVEQHLRNALSLNIDISKIVIVWNSYILGNRKWMIAYIPTKLYFEVTYNSNKNEVYVDIYEKIENNKIDINSLNEINNLN